jgi:hypothetical protein
MFPGSPDVFANIPDEHRPDMSQPAAPPVQQAHVPAADGMGLGQSPDGLGLGTAMPMGAAPDGLGGKLTFVEPTDASPDAAVRSAGITALVAAVTFGGGLALGGPWGGISGLSFSGAAFNVYRAQKWWGSPDASEKHEAVVSGLMGVIGIIVGGYAGYQAYQTKGGS